MFRVAVAAAEMLSVVDPAGGGNKEQAQVPAAVAAPPVWDLVAAVAVEVVVGAGNAEKERSNEMKSTSSNKNLLGLAWVLSAIAMISLPVPALLTDQQPAVKE